MIKNYKPLQPQPFYSGISKFVQIADPWHSDAFKGTFAEHVIPHNPEHQKQVWAAEDWFGNIVAVLAENPPFDNAMIEYIDDTEDWCWVLRENG